MGVGHRPQEPLQLAPLEEEPAASDDLLHRLHRVSRFHPC